MLAGNQLMQNGAKLKYLQKKFKIIRLSEECSHGLLLGIVWFGNGCVWNNEIKLKWYAVSWCKSLSPEIQGVVTRNLCSAKKL